MLQAELTHKDPPGDYFFLNEDFRTVFVYGLESLDKGVIFTM